MVQHHHLHYTGSTSRIFSIFIIHNVILNILTLSLYRFWGRTVMRRYVFSHLSLQDKPFAYFGTGRDALIDFAKSMITLSCFFVVMAALALLLTNSIDGISKPAAWAAIFFIVIATLHRVTQYKISHLAWNTHPLQFSGSISSYASLVLWRWCLNILTLGIVIPYSDVKIYQHLIQEFSIGGNKARFDGEVTETLVKLNIITLALWIPTCGISRFWYQAAWKRYKFSHTHLAEATCCASDTGKSLASLYLGNLCIIILTVGVGIPWVIQRNMHYLTTHFSIVTET